VTTPPEGQPATQPPAPEPTPTTPPAPEQEPTEPRKEDGSVDWEAVARATRQEAASYRTRLRATEGERDAFKTKAEEYERSQLTEQERVAADLEAARGLSKAQAETITRLQLQNEVLARTSAHGIVDADAAYRLLDQSQVVYEDGRPVNVDQLLETLVTNKPWLKGSGTPSVPLPDVQPTNAPRVPPSTLTIDDIKKMTPQQINARWDEVSRVLETSGR
jgi:type IV secretory pathway VirB10-like protein